MLISLHLTSIYPECPGIEPSILGLLLLIGLTETKYF